MLKQHNFESHTFELKKPRKISKILLKRMYINLNGYGRPNNLEDSFYNEPLIEFEESLFGTGFYKIG